MKGLRVLVVFLITVPVFFYGCDTSENVLPHDKTFVKLYGTDGNQFGVDFEQLSNNQLVILAKNEKPINSSFILIFVDEQGNELNQLEYKPSADYSMIPTALAVDKNGNIVVVGNHVTVSFNDIFVYRISPSGEVLNYMLYNITDQGDVTFNRLDMVQDLVVDAENRYIISGYSKDGANNPEEFFALKLNKQLMIEADWSRIVHPSDIFETGKYRRTHSRLGFTKDRIISLSTSEFFAGETAPANLNIEIFYLNKQYGTADFQSTGTAFIGTDFYDEINGFSPTLTGFAFIGTTVRTTSSSLIVGELGGDGIKINDFSLTARNLKGIDIGKNDITGRLVILAEEILSADNKNVHMAEVDNIGNVIWEHAYGGNDIDDAAALIIKGNSIYMLGSLKMNSQNKVVIIKTDGEGKL